MNGLMAEKILPSVQQAKIKGWLNINKAGEAMKFWKVSAKTHTLPLTPDHMEKAQAMMGAWHA